VQPKKPDIIMLALARWDGPYASTAFSLAKELSKDTRVFYVDNPFTIKRALRRFRSKQVLSRLQPLFLGRCVEKQIDSNYPNLLNVRPGVVMPVNFLTQGTLYNFFSEFNDFIIKLAIQSVIKRHKLSNYIIINSFNPFYLLNVQRYKPVLSIYHCVDNIAESKHVNKHGKRLEQEAMKKYDITITTSKNLFEKASRFSNNVYCIPNAADFDHFNKASRNNFERPAELKGLEGKKIIGYIGNICLRLNYDLIKRLSEVHADKIILMIGPITDQEFYRYNLDKQQNIITTGKKDYADLPKYLHYFDCSIIPFKCNELTRNIYPLKLNEYLAAGKPVVTTNFSPDLQDFRGTVQIAQNIDNFIEKVSEELVTDDSVKQRLRMEVAMRNTWAARAEDFWVKVLPFLAKVTNEQYV
jgi:teichuronic acid biosynthesis glycosyltransferase TuaH